MAREPSPSVTVVWENACETCDTAGPAEPVVELDSEAHGRTFICARCAKLALAVLRELGLTS